MNQTWEAISDYQCYQWHKIKNYKLSQYMFTMILECVGEHKSYQQLQTLSMDSQHQNIHIPVSVWLQTIDLPQYDSLFARYKGAQV